MLAEMLGLDLVAQVEALQGSRAGLDLHRDAGSEDEHVLAKPPLLLTIAPRFSPAPHATSWGVGEAWAKPLQAWKLADLALGPAEMEPASDVASLARAEQAKASAERFEGDAEEATSQLVRRLRAGGWLR
jgi:electron transfer flavoprotein alpha/beta subunit